MKLPFRASTPAARNVNAPAQKRGLMPGEPAKHAAAEGETLVDAGIEVGVPDYDVGSATPHEGGQQHGEGHVQRPEHRPNISWPPADNGRKPFKF